jgi:hypothetical protein
MDMKLSREREREREREDELALPQPCRKAEALKERGERDEISAVNLEPSTTESQPLR